MTVKHQGIRLVIYSAENDSDSQKIMACGARIFPPAQMIVCRETQEVAEALKGVLSGYGILVALIRHQKELEMLARTQDRLRDHAVIFIIEDGNQALMSLALKFYPRYTSGFKDRYTDIFQVLENMTTKIETKAKGEENGSVRGG